MCSRTWATVVVDLPTHLSSRVLSDCVFVCDANENIFYKSIILELVRRSQLRCSFRKPNYRRFVCAFWYDFCGRFWYILCINIVYIYVYVYAYVNVVIYFRPESCVNVTQWTEFKYLKWNECAFHNNG